MCKVDLPANNSEARLNSALRSLADASATGAPSEMGEALIGAFRRHHARRRAVRRTAWAATVCAVLLAAVVWLEVGRPVNPSVAKTPVPEAVSPQVPIPMENTVNARPLPRVRRIRPAVKSAAKAPAGDFVVLSSYDQPVPEEELRVIRLEVTGNALRMVGAPVMEPRENRSVLADFVVGQDGTPYAVRLVRSRYSR
jgi:hypothetical protein